MSIEIREHNEFNEVKAVSLAEVDSIFKLTEDYCKPTAIGIFTSGDQIFTMTKQYGGDKGQSVQLPQGTIDRDEFGDYSEGQFGLTLLARFTLPNEIEFEPLDYTLYQAKRIGNTRNPHSHRQPKPRIFIPVISIEDIPLTQIVEPINNSGGSLTPAWISMNKAISLLNREDEKSGYRGRQRRQITRKVIESTMDFIGGT